jgi:hypothetical protein
MMFLWSIMSAQQLDYYWYPPYRLGLSEPGNKEYTGNLIVQWKRLSPRHSLQSYALCNAYPVPEGLGVSHFVGRNGRERSAIPRTVMMGTGISLEMTIWLHCMETVLFIRLTVNNTDAWSGRFAVRVHMQSAPFWVTTGMGCRHTLIVEVIICCLPSNWTWRTTPHLILTCWDFFSTEVFALFAFQVLSGEQRNTDVVESCCVVSPFGAGPEIPLLDLA